jgi:hypothetical protein
MEEQNQQNSNNVTSASTLNSNSDSGQASIMEMEEQNQQNSSNVTSAPTLNSNSGSGGQVSVNEPPKQPPTPNGSAPITPAQIKLSPPLTLNNRVSPKWKLTHTLGLLCIIASILYINLWLVNQPGNSSQSLPQIT